MTVRPLSLPATSTRYVVPRSVAPVTTSENVPVRGSILMPAIGCTTYSV